jgi:hypothetical protein
MELYATRIESTRVNRAGSFPVCIKAPAAEPLADVLDHQLRQMWTMVERLYTDDSADTSTSCRSAAAMPGRR